MKILVIIQDISKAQEHEWFVEYLNRDLFDLHFLLINGKNTYMDSFLQKHNVPVSHLSYMGKSDLPGLILSIRKLLVNGKFRIIHTHLFEATLAGLTAARLAGTKGRIYTRHYSDYHHVWFPGTVKYDRINNFLANRIVATSNNVKQVLLSREGVSESKIRLINHGIDISDYQSGAVAAERVMTIRKKYGIEGRYPVIGCISRFTMLKGIQYLIPAFIRLKEKYPAALLVLANASGDYFKEIMAMLAETGNEHYRLIEFENDVPALYKTFDCFVHVPINVTAEAFGQTYLEALASGIPSVFTLSGIAPEFIIDRKNALVVPHCDGDAIFGALSSLLENQSLAASLISEGYESVKNKFDIHIKMRSLEKLYSEFE